MSCSGARTIYRAKGTLSIVARRALTVPSTQYHFIVNGSDEYFVEPIGYRRRNRHMVGCETGSMCLPPAGCAAGRAPGRAGEVGTASSAQSPAVPTPLISPKRVIRFFNRRPGFLRSPSRTADLQNETLRAPPEQRGGNDGYQDVFISCPLRYRFMAFVGLVVDGLYKIIKALDRLTGEIRAIGFDMDKMRVALCHQVSDQVAPGVGTPGIGRTGGADLRTRGYTVSASSGIGEI